MAAMISLSELLEKSDTVEKVEKFAPTEFIEFKEPNKGFPDITMKTDVSRFDKAPFTFPPECALSGVNYFNSAIRFLQDLPRLFPEGVFSLPPKFLPVLRGFAIRIKPMDNYNFLVFAKYEGKKEGGSIRSYLGTDSSQIFSKETYDVMSLYSVLKKTPYSDVSAFLEALCDVASSQSKFLEKE
jgi:hypothetical protein